jgi:hypothetical protein
MSRSGNPGNREPASGSATSDSVERNESMTDGIGPRRLADWMTRSRSAMLAEFKLVDSGSLDVLLYCEDDLAAASTPADAEAERAR